VKVVLVAMILLGTACIPTMSSSDLTDQTKLVAFSSRELELLAGPLTRSASTAYDRLQLVEGRKYAQAYPVGVGVYDNYHSDDVSKNFYDQALALYIIYFRTGDVYWRDKARVVATDWMKSPYNTNIPTWLSTQREGLQLPLQALASQILGVAVMAVEAGDRAAAQTVNNQAELYGAGTRGLTGTPTGLYDGFGDGREAGYRLMAATAAVVLGFDHRAPAKRQLDVILARQRHDGFWTSWIPHYHPVPPGTPDFCQNFMNGILLEALAFYDRAIGDPRILPAMINNMRWTWETQWVPSAQAFQYCSVSYAFKGQSCERTPFAALNGLMLPAWGYVYSRTGDQKYLEQGDKILTGLVARGRLEISGQKQFTQMFRSSSRFLGYRALGASGPKASGTPAASVAIMPLFSIPSGIEPPATTVSWAAPLR
jgi:hypothetical protein